MSKIIEQLEALEDKKFDNLVSSFGNTDDTLLLAAPKESLEVLQKVGLDYKLRKDIENKAQKDKIIHLSKILGQSFSGGAIKELCITYDLCIYPAGWFRGDIDYSIIGKAITDFCESKNILPNYSSFYVLAPSEYFDSETKGNFNLECVLFFKEGRNDLPIEEETTLIKVTSWGDKLPFYRVFNNSFFTYSDGDELSSLTFTIINLLVFLLSFISGALNNYPLSFFLGFVGVGLVLINGLKEKYKYTKWSDQK